MIQQQIIGGRPATVAYLKGDFEPGTPDDHDAVKIIFDDGDVVFARQKQPASALSSIPGGAADSYRIVGPPAADREWVEAQHPRGQPKNKGEFARKGGGTTAAAAPAQTETSVSPNVQNNITFAPARAALASQAQRGLAEASSAIGPPLTPLPGSRGHPALISTRRPTAKGSVDGDMYRRADLDAMRLDPDKFTHDMNLFRDPIGYPNLRPDQTEGKTPDEIARSMIDHAEANLKFLYQNAPAQLRALGHLWYEGANRIATEAASKYHLPLQSVVGVYAALSPQKLWDMNVYLGDQVIAIPTRPSRTTPGITIWRRPRRVFGSRRTSRSLTTCAARRWANSTPRPRRRFGSGRTTRRTATGLSAKCPPMGRAAIGTATSMVAARKRPGRRCPAWPTRLGLWSLAATATNSAR